MCVRWHLLRVEPPSARLPIRAILWTGQDIVGPRRCDSSRQGRAVRHKMEILTRRHIATVNALPRRRIVRPLMDLERIPQVQRW